MKPVVIGHRSDSCSGANLEDTVSASSSRIHSFSAVDHFGLLLGRINLKAEAYGASDTVRLIIGSSELSPITDIGRNSWRPLNAGTSVDQKAVVPYVGSKNRCCNAWESRSAKT